VKIQPFERRSLFLSHKLTNLYSLLKKDANRNI